MEVLTIGQVARRADVGVETVRFYERQGLIEKPPRKTSGYRQYPDEAVRRILFIRRAKELGFSLRDIKELLALRVDPSTKCSEIRQRGQAKIVQIDEKIRTLQRMKKALKKLAAACNGNGPASKCPILEALEARKEES